MGDVAATVKLFIYSFLLISERRCGHESEDKCATPLEIRSVFSQPGKSERDSGERMMLL